MGRRGGVEGGCIYRWESFTFVLVGLMTGGGMTAWCICSSVAAWTLDWMWKYERLTLSQLGEHEIGNN